MLTERKTPSQGTAGNTGLGSGRREKSCTAGLEKSPLLCLDLLIFSRILS